MFDDLLSQFNDVLAEAKTITKNKIEFSQSDRSDSVGCDYTKPLGAVCSFGKSQRFKQASKQELSTSHIEWSTSAEQSVQKITTFTFTKGDRFQFQKQKYAQTYINPNYAVIKKNTTTNVPVYKKPVSKDLAKSNVSSSTVDSETLRGPGVYQIKQEVRVKNGVFLKDTRFKQEKPKYEDVPLVITQNQTRKRPPSAALMKKKTQKNKQLISREQQEELRQKLKYVYWKNIPLELDRMFKTNIGPVIKEQYFNLSKLTGTQKRSAILMLLDRLRYQRGGFQYETKGTMDSACAVIYRKSTPKPFKFSQMQPGPDYYYPIDDLTRPQPQAFTFKKAGIVQKKKIYDNRDYQIREELLKKGGNIIINPVHEQHRLTEYQIASLQRGPGFYDCLFGQVEKRKDIGVLKFQEITQKNDRANNCVDIKEVNDGLYFPSYQAIDANVPAPLFKEPSDVKPAHLPQKILFPEHWLFYSGDLNKVRAQIAKNVIMAKNMSYKDYNIYREKFERFKEYLNLQKRTPEVGQYQVSYDVIDPHVPEIDMTRQPQKTLIQPIIKPEGHSAGDNLILNPKGFQQHLPNMQFNKMIGRADQMDIDKHGQPKQGDRLILNPTKIEKHIPSVDFNKQQDRPEGKQFGQDDLGPEGDVLIINPQPIQKHIANVDFSKQADRKQIKIDKNQLQQQAILQVEQKPVIKGVGFSRLSSVRLVPHLRSNLKSQQKKQSVYNR